MRLLEGIMQLLTGATGVIVKHVGGALQVRNLADDAFAPVQTGKLTLPAATTGGASLNVPHGAAPTSPANGDIWTTTAAPFVRINGVTRTIYHSGNAGTAALSTVTQAEAEAGTATTVRGWTAQRVAQAVIARLPTKLSELENDIGAGAGLTIVASSIEPPQLVTGDWWYKEV